MPRSRRHNSSSEPGRVGGQRTGMEALIPIVNKIADVFNMTGGGEGMNLPQIVVVGNQSDGKSTVLERLVGHKFLPRGTGIATRCPIYLKLIHSPDEEYCQFTHKDMKYTDFGEVETEIVNRTNELAGTNCGITMEPISLTVNSPDVLTLTVVDLPGIVKVPQGDQPADIGAQVEQLIMKYITPINSIILAIHAAGNDIWASESLNYARKVDPNGDRTLIVCTKLDMAGDVSATLEGSTIPVKLGIVGVLTRKPIAEATEDEEEFLRTRYPLIAARHGTPVLAARLNHTLMHHIGKCFPSLDMRIKELALQYRDRLDGLGNSNILEEEEKRVKMVDLLNDFQELFKGEFLGQTLDLDSSTLCGAARVDLIFKDTLQTDLQSLDPLHELSDKEIMFAIRNTHGVLANLNLSEVAFQELLKKRVKLSKEVVLHCANLVHQEMQNAMQTCLEKIGSRFPKLNQAIAAVVNELLNDRIQVAREILENYIAVSSSCVFTKDEDFAKMITASIGKVSVEEQVTMPLSHVLKFGPGDPILKTSGVGTIVPPAPATGGNPNGFNDNQKMACEAVKQMMITTFNIVRAQIGDYVPKSLTHSVVYYAVKNVHKNLNLKLNTADNIEELIQEDESIAKTRKTISKELEAIEKASELLDEVKHYSKDQGLSFS